MRIAFLLLLISASALSAQELPEDAEHRADRLRTEQLNRRAQVAADKREDANRAKLDRYARDRAAYQREMAEWRRRSEACVNGDYSVCDSR